MEIKEAINEEEKKDVVKQKKESKTRARPEKQIKSHKSPRIVSVYISPIEPKRQMRFDWNDNSQRFELQFG